jgi:hypothetical protein
MLQSESKRRGKTCIIGKLKMESFNKYVIQDGIYIRRPPDGGGDDDDCRSKSVVRCK